MTGEQIDSLEQRMGRTKRSRILQDRQRFVKTPIVELELRKLEETFGQRGQLGVGAPQLAEDPRSRSRDARRAVHFSRDTIAPGRGGAGWGRWPTSVAPGSTAFVRRDKADRAS